MKLNALGVGFILALSVGSTASAAIHWGEFNNCDSGDAGDSAVQNAIQDVFDNNDVSNNDHIKIRNIDPESVTPFSASPVRGPGGPFCRFRVSPLGFLRDFWVYLSRGFLFYAS